MEKPSSSVFVNLFRAFYSPKNYPTFIRLRNGKVFLYILLLSLITVAFTLVPLSSYFFSHYGSLEKVITHNIPDFSLKDGTFSVDKTVHFTQAGSTILLDTGTTFDEDVLYGCSMGFAVDNEKFIYVDTRENKTPQIIYFSDLKDARFDKTTLIGFIPAMHVFIGISCAMYYLVVVLAFAFTSLVGALVAMVVSSIMRTRLLFGDLFKISVYCHTVPHILAQVFVLLTIVSALFFHGAPPAIMALLMGILAFTVRPILGFYIIFVILVALVLRSIKKQRAEEALLAQTNGANVSDQIYSNPNPEVQKPEDSDDSNAPKPPNSYKF